MSAFVFALLSAALSVPGSSRPASHFEDAALHSVYFVDKAEGWAVGDDGVIWHTYDGGENWERQPSGVRASLRCVHFLTPYTGWVVGREELPHGGSVGVLLMTRDGGLKWRRVGLNLFPGLNRVRFFDDRVGIVVGDGTEAFPSGIFQTTDGGQNWQPVAGPRCTTWRAADFQDAQTGVLAGAWNRLATWQAGRLGAADVDTLGGRSLYDVQLIGKRAVAVGQGGLVLISTNTAGLRWGFADLQLPMDVLACCDFHAVSCVGDHIWIVGRPGSVVLHSPDRGVTWQLHGTGQPLALHGVHFIDAQQGWAVGELGCILATRDGGRTWKTQRRGGQRAAVLFIHAQATGIPLDTMAQVGGEDGYLTAALRVMAADPASAPPERAAEAQALADAVRRVGGASAETLWQFPLPRHLAGAERSRLLAHWDRAHDDKASEQLLRQLVLALRIWQPEVVIVDHPDERITEAPMEALLSQAVYEANTRAADADTFPEQIATLKLSPWSVQKLYGVWDDSKTAHVIFDLTQYQLRSRTTPAQQAEPACGILAKRPVRLPNQRCYRLLASRLEGADKHQLLLQGISLAAGGTARRMLPDVDDSDTETEKHIRTRHNLRSLAETPLKGLADPSRVLAQMGPVLGSLPDQHAAAAAFAVASHYAEQGEWMLAQEVFLLMVERYPAHPLSAEAYRWLIRHNSSSEVQRRRELKQFITVDEFQPNQVPTTEHAGLPIQGGVRTEIRHNLFLVRDSADARRWREGALRIENRLGAFGPIYATDPAVNFCCQAARRQLGDVEGTKAWYARYVNEQPPGPWRQAAAAELWLLDRGRVPGKPVIHCRQTAARPYLDGHADDDCWQNVKPVVLHDAVAATSHSHATEARFRYDADFLYVAISCQHPEGEYVAPLRPRRRDEDLRPFDRVELLLDLDRDYGTYFRLCVDQRGCVAEDCWGDASWNPRWFVAHKSTPTSWHIEVAIPLLELTGDPVTLGNVWACNLVRVIPGQGVQAFSLPADAEPRPEGMGLLLFMQELKDTVGRANHAEQP
ncbi:MAG: YCF48-related protein [Gemmataceae bacterium]